MAAYESFAARPPGYWWRVWEAKQGKARSLGRGAATLEVNPGDYVADHVDPVTGELSKERQALHDDLIRQSLEGYEPAPPGERNLRLLAGGAASGKSSTDKSKEEGRLEVNPDTFKEMLPEVIAARASGAKADGEDGWAARSHEESSYLAKRLARAALDRGITFTRDGTGSKEAGEISLIEAARAEGYSIDTKVSTLPVDIAIERATARAKKTGREVPMTALRLGHRGVSQVQPKTLPLADRGWVYDTTRKPPTLVAEYVNGKQTIHDQGLWQDFLDKGKAHIPKASAAASGLRRAHLAARLAGSPSGDYNGYREEGGSVTDFSMAELNKVIRAAVLGQPRPKTSVPDDVAEEAEREVAEIHARGHVVDFID